MAQIKKNWKELTGGKKRMKLWNVICNKEIEFEKRVGKDYFTNLLMRTKETDFEEKADEIREEIYTRCVSFNLDSKLFEFVKRELMK